LANLKLYDPGGRRLYLNAGECQAFLDAARKARRNLHTLCETLHYTGARLSEALALTPERVDLTGAVILRSLKKRGLAAAQGHYRAVPVPKGYLDTLDMAHALRDAQRRGQGHADQPLWIWSRQHTWQLVKEVMIQAEIPDGPQRTPTGLRHAFGIAAVTANLPLTLLAKWKGHASIDTPAIYANATGPEEQVIAARMWR
jgi:integrase